MSGPFSDVCVLDLTSLFSGPMAKLILLDQGADVNKIEAADGDFPRHVTARRAGYSAAFLKNNRNKNSVVLDQKSDKDKAALLKMAAQWDIFVQNFRPGMADHLGFGEDALQELNPRLVYLSIAGLGFKGPLADRSVYDPLIQAISSLASVQTGSDQARPKLVRKILSDKLPEVLASQALTVAFFHRELSDKGHSARLSMLDKIVSFLWGSDMVGHTFVGDERDAKEAQSFIDLICEVFDGYVSVAIMQDKHLDAFAYAVGHAQRLSDARFVTAELREVHRYARLKVTQDAIRTYSCEELIRLLDNAGVPCAPVLKRHQMRQHPQTVANESLVEYAHNQAGRLRQAAPVKRFSRTPSRVRNVAPVLGANTQTVLAEFGIEPC
ncbi:MAG: CaiB/BaiF CoA transferase family protein [Roseobacter sp.]